MAPFFWMQPLHPWLLATDVLRDVNGVVEGLLKVAVVLSEAE